MTEPSKEPEADALLPLYVTKSREKTEELILFPSCIVGDIH